MLLLSVYDDRFDRQLKSIRTVCYNNLQQCNLPIIPSRPMQKPFQVYREELAYYGHYSQV